MPTSSQHRTARRRFCLLGLVLGTFLSAIAPAQDYEILREVRDEFWVDGPNVVQPGTNRSRPDVAIDPLGRVIQVFQVNGAVGGDNLDIFVRRFGLDDVPLDAPEMVNTTVDDNQEHPQVAVRADGAFFVVWQSLEFDGDDGDERRWVRGQFFDSNGDPQGSERLVSEVSSGVKPYEIGASVAALANGSFVVVWESRKGFGTDSQECARGAVGCGSYSIQARRVSATGVPTGSQFQINVDPDRNQEDPAVAPTADGGFFVVWQSNNSIGTDTGDAIQGRRFPASGTTSPYPEIQLNTTTSGDQHSADVASNTIGQILVAFESPNQSNVFGTVRARMFDADLTPLGNDFPLSTIEPEERQDTVRVAGGVDFFMAVWEVEGLGIGSDEDLAINGRIVLGPSQFEGGQFQVNVFEEDFQQFPGIGGYGQDVVVAWDATLHAFEEADDGIIARGYRFCSFFCDDFETGDKSLWSSETP